MDESQLPLLISITLALMGTMALIIALFLRRKLSRRVDESEISPGSRWSLGAVVEPGMKCNLCLEFKIQYYGGEDDYGIAVEYDLRAGGELLSSERAGVGNVTPPESDRRIGTQYRTSLTAVLGKNSYRATVVVCSIGPFEQRREINATGTVHTAAGTLLQKGIVFLSVEG